MAGYGSLPSPKDAQRKLTSSSSSSSSSSSIFLAPRLFSGFTSKGISDSESLLSPTSILDTKPFSAFRNPFWVSDSKPTNPKPKPKPKSNWDKLRDSIGVGLAIVDALKDDDDDNDKSTPNFSKPDNHRMVLFGSQLKIQIPPSSSVFQSPPKSPADFGIKTRNAQLGPRRSGSRSPPPAPAPGCSSLSASEMELSEDYTRVISYGPNPKTTHIFDDCIVQSCGSTEVVGGFPATGNKPVTTSCSSESFLSCCCSCKKSLGNGKDIYIYRGEKAFCSSECRYKEMMLEDEDEQKKMKLEVDDHHDDMFW